MPLPDDLLHPIEGPNPCGEEVRYESVFDEIKEARRVEEDGPREDWDRDPKTADYGAVISLATDVLANRSKDLQVAAWLTEGLLRQGGIDGLNDGLAVVHGLLENFWDHVHPQLEGDDAALRAAPLDWLGTSFPIENGVRLAPLNGSAHSYLDYKASRDIPRDGEIEGDEERQAKRDEAIDAGHITPEAFDAAFDETPKAWYKSLVADLKACQATIKALEEIARTKFGGDAPGYGKLKTSLEEVAIVAMQLLRIKLEHDPDPVDETSLLTDTGDEGDGRVSVEPSSVDDATARIGVAARYLQAHDPQNPASYLMLRGLRWGELRRAAPDVNPKQLSAPPTHVRTQLKTLLLDEKWPQLLSAGEAVMATPHGRGWLDLQRYVLTACQNLGAEYDAVADAIRGAITALLKDIPDLPQLTLMDDTPTANAETRAWLRDLFATRRVSEAIEIPAIEEELKIAARDDDSRGPLTRSAHDRAMSLMRSGQPERGIELLMREAEQEKSPRDKFLRRAQAADIMVNSGLQEVAMPILRELLAQIEQHQLEAWEAGETVARPMGLLYRCLKTVEGESETTEDLYLRMCRLDPLQAIGFSNRNDSAANQVGSGVREGGNDGEAGS